LTLTLTLSEVAVTSCSFYVKCSACRLGAGRRTLKMCCYRSRNVFQLLLLRRWHFTRYCSDTTEVRWHL